VDFILSSFLSGNLKINPANFAHYFSILRGEKTANKELFKDFFSLKAMENIQISRISAQSPEYAELWRLRDEVLRKPIGLSLANDDLSRDLVDTIFIARHQANVIGCVLLHPLEAGVAQLRAMAVYPEWQGKGIGRLLVMAFEKYAFEYGYSKIILHARKVALGFYSGLGYTAYGDEFREVGIPHFMMEKELKG
jgi:GNAT superfamily N-acetyltransferase